MIRLIKLNMKGLRSRKSKLRLRSLSKRGLRSLSIIEDYKRSLKGWNRWSRKGLRSSKSRLRVIRLKRLSRRGLRSSKSKLRVRRLIRLSRRGLTYWSRIEDYKRSLKGWRR